MVKLSPFALARLSNAAYQISMEPHGFVMTNGKQIETGTSCGTAACIGGRLVSDHLPEFFGRKDDWGSIGNMAIRTLLESPDDDVFRYQIGGYDCWGFPLFHKEKWPLEYSSRFNDGAEAVLDDYDSHERREKVFAARRNNAQVAVELINRIVHEGGIFWVEPRQVDQDEEEDEESY